MMTGEHPHDREEGMMPEQQEPGLHMKVASVLPREIGDYWKGVSDERQPGGGPVFVWYVRSRTGTFTRHCQADAAQSAQNAKAELAKYNRKQQMSFQRKIEEVMENMLDYYEDLHDISKEIAMWADDYVAMETGRTT